MENINRVQVKVTIKNRAEFKSADLTRLIFMGSSSEFIYSRVTRFSIYKVFYLPVSYKISFVAVPLQGISLVEGFLVQRSDCIS